MPGKVSAPTPPLKALYVNGTLKEPQVDSAFSTSSTNPIQNKVVTERLNTLGADATNLTNRVTAVEAKVNAFECGVHIATTQEEFDAFITEDNIGELISFNNVLYMVVRNEETNEITTKVAGGSVSASLVAENEEQFNAALVAENVGKTISYNNKIYLIIEALTGFQTGDVVKADGIFFNSGLTIEETDGILNQIPWENFELESGLCGFWSLKNITGSEGLIIYKFSDYEFYSYGSESSTKISGYLIFNVAEYSEDYKVIYTSNQGILDWFYSTGAEIEQESGWNSTAIEEYKSLLPVMLGGVDVQAEGAPANTQHIWGQLINKSSTFETAQILATKLIDENDFKEVQSLLPKIYIGDYVDKIYINNTSADSVTWMQNNSGPMHTIEFDNGKKLMFSSWSDSSGEFHSMLFYGSNGSSSDYIFYDTSGSSSLDGWNPNFNGSYSIGAKVVSITGGIWDNIDFIRKQPFEKEPGIKRRALAVGDYVSTLYIDKNYSLKTLESSLSTSLAVKFENGWGLIATKFESLVFGFLSSGNTFFPFTIMATTDASSAGYWMPGFDGKFEINSKITEITENPILLTTDLVYQEDLTIDLGKQFVGYYINKNNTLVNNLNTTMYSGQKYRLVLKGGRVLIIEKDDNGLKIVAQYDANTTSQRYVFYQSYDYDSLGWTGWNSEFNSFYSFSGEIESITGTVWLDRTFIQPVVKKDNLIENLHITGYTNGAPLVIDQQYGADESLSKPIPAIEVTNALSNTTTSLYAQMPDDVDGHSGEKHMLILPFKDGTLATTDDIPIIDREFDILSTNALRNQTIGEWKNKVDAALTTGTKIKVNDYIGTIFINREKLMGIYTSTDYKYPPYVEFENGKKLKLEFIGDITDLCIAITYGTDESNDYIFYQSKPYLTNQWTGWDPSFSGGYGINSTIINIYNESGFWEDSTFVSSTPFVYGVSIPVDEALSETSTNPVQNKVIANEIKILQDYIENASGSGSTQLKVGDVLENIYIAQDTEWLTTNAGSNTIITFEDGRQLFAAKDGGTTALVMLGPNGGSDLEYVFYDATGSLGFGFTDWNPEFTGEYAINSTVTTITGAIWENADFISSTPFGDTIDGNLSLNSKNPVQNKVLAQKFYEIEGNGTPLKVGDYVKRIYFANDDYGKAWMEKQPGMSTDEINVGQRITFNKLGSSGKNLVLGFLKFDYDGGSGILLHYTEIDGDSQAVLYNMYSEDLGPYGWNPNGLNYIDVDAEILEISGYLWSNGNFISSTPLTKTVAVDSKLIDGSTNTIQTNVVVDTLNTIVGTPAFGYDGSVSTQLINNARVNYVYFDTSQAGIDYMAEYTFNVLNGVSFTEIVAVQDGSKLTFSYDVDTDAYTIVFADYTGSSYVEETLYDSANAGWTDEMLSAGKIYIGNYLTAVNPFWQNKEFASSTPFGTPPTTAEYKTLVKLTKDIESLNTTLFGNKDGDLVVGTAVENLYINNGDESIEYIRNTWAALGDESATLFDVMFFENDDMIVTLCLYYNDAITTAIWKQNLTDKTNYFIYQSSDLLGLGLTGWNPDFNGELAINSTVRAFGKGTSTVVTDKSNTVFTNSAFVSSAPFENINIRIANLEARIAQLETLLAEAETRLSAI